MGNASLTHPAAVSLLTFTTLYPNSAQPNHGVFVENRLRQLVKTGEVTAKVMAPVAWFPGRTRIGAPARETRNGLDVLHPRWLSIPGPGMNVAPFLLYREAARALKNFFDAGEKFDAIDAHYFYPDGVAAIRLGRRFNLPVVITARGSDVTQFPDYAIPRRLILDAARRADAIITVSQGLSDALMRLGAPAEKITVLRNGVDLKTFCPVDRARARAAFSVGRRCLVSVGALIPRKGHDLTIAALAQLPGWQLLIAGAGPELARLQAHAASLGVSDRVTFLGAIPHTKLPELYSAADLSVLASSREGWANVLLESMACGTQVIASPIPGNTEVVQAPEAGIVAADRSADAIARAVRQWEAAPGERAATRAYAEKFSWDDTSRGQLALFRRVISRK
jgi:glycosyltransferase involved in cell wall biosynthesis